MQAGLFRLYLGPLMLKVSSNIPEFVTVFRELYGDHTVGLAGGEYDFDLAVRPPSFWRRWYRRNAVFEFCGDVPFQPMEVGHSHAMFEWGLNWAIASFMHTHLIIHSAVVEWKGKGVLLSAVSGSGKSTLSAELSLQGWRCGLRPDAGRRLVSGGLVDGRQQDMPGFLAGRCRCRRGRV